MQFGWKPEKNDKLKAGYKGRQPICFEDVVLAISEGGLIGSRLYKGPKEVFQGQVILLVRIDGIEHWVPATWTGDLLFLRTIFPRVK